MTESDHDAGQAVVSPPADDGRSPGHRPRRHRLRLRNWRVTVRLVALIVIPTVVAGVLAGLRVSSAIGNAQQYARIERLATLGNDLSALTHSLESERALVAEYVAVPAARRLTAQPLKNRQGQVDAAAKKVRADAAGVGGSYAPAVRDKVRDVVNRIDDLTLLREVTAHSQMPPTEIIDKYSVYVTDLIDFDEQIAQGAADVDLTTSVRALAALARAKDAASKEQAVLAIALYTRKLDSTQLDDLQTARAQRDSELAVFRSAADSSEATAYDDTVTGPEIDRAEFIRQRALAIAQNAQGQSLRPLGAKDAIQWSTDDVAGIDRMRQVEDKIANAVVDRGATLRDDAWQSAAIIGGLLLLVLIVVVLVLLIVAQSLVRPLRRLRSGALEVAGSRLPELVRRLRDAEPAEGQRFDVAPIDVDTTDEIGEVARAFDEVHREAVRLAADEAMLRGNFNAMFVNLSRRSQSLIERQLRLIEDLERGEQDADRLDSLFKLDHLATRMRRNGENLLVLGGQDQARRWTKPVPLVDIVRASLSEIEQYERVSLRIQDEVSLVGRAVNDLVHLVAELVENATTLSPEHTKVAVSGHLLSGGGAMLQISDNGVGMSAEELEEANWRLANPPTVDVAVARRMGLFVVGRLAQRHGIRVELRAALSGGLTAFVILPATAIMHGDVDPRQLENAPQAEAIVAAAQSPFGTAQADPGTGPMPAFGGQRPPRRELPTGSQPGYGRQDDPATGPMPSIEQPGTARPAGTPGGRYDDQTGPMPVFGSDSGFGEEHGTGPRPAFGQSGGYGSAAEEHTTGPRPAYGSAEEARPAFGRRDEQPYGEDSTGPRPAYDPRRQEAEPVYPPRPRTGEQPAVFSAPVPELTERPSGTPLPRRKPGPTAPPGRGAAPSSPARSGAQRPPSATGPQRPGGSGGSVFEDGRSASEGSGRSPIFEAMQSEWFQRRKTPGTPTAQQPAPPPRAASWSSPGDEGWRAAETVRAPSVGGQTDSGLPKRVPGRNRVPGSAGAASGSPNTTAPAAPQQPAPPAAAPQPPQADHVRNRFASFQQGVRKGRAATRPGEDERENE